MLVESQNQIVTRVSTRFFSSPTPQIWGIPGIASKTICRATYRKALCAVSVVRGLRRMCPPQSLGGRSYAGTRPSRKRYSVELHGVRAEFRGSRSVNSSCVWIRCKGCSARVAGRRFMKVSIQNVHGCFRRVTAGPSYLSEASGSSPRLDEYPTLGSPRDPEKSGPENAAPGGSSCSHSDRRAPVAPQELPPACSDACATGEGVSPKVVLPPPLLPGVRVPGGVQGFAWGFTPRRLANLKGSAEVREPPTALTCSLGGGVVAVVVKLMGAVGEVMMLPWQGHCDPGCGTVSCGPSEGLFLCSAGNESGGCSLGKNWARCTHTSR
eukprot:RCo022955